MMPELMREAIDIAVDEWEGETLVEFGQYVSRHAETLLRDAADGLAAERRRRAAFARFYALEVQRVREMSKAKKHLVEEDD